MFFLTIVCIKIAAPACMADFNGTKPYRTERECRAAGEAIGIVWMGLRPAVYQVKCERKSRGAES